MKPIISISTGLVYKFYQDRNEMVRILRRFNPDGIELNFFEAQLLLDFELDADNLEYLKKLQHVSIHAPWINITYEDSEHCNKVLSKIAMLANLVNAKVVVVEREQIKDFSVFEKYDLPFAIENDDWRKNTDTKTPEGIENILLKNEKFGFCLDVAHATTITDYGYVDQFLKKCGSRISQFHSAYINKSMSDHWFLHKNDTAEIREMIKRIKSLNKPIVIESVALSKAEINDINKEINYLKRI